MVAESRCTYNKLLTAFVTSNRSRRPCTVDSKFSRTYFCAYHHPSPITRLHQQRVTKLIEESPFIIHIYTRAGHARICRRSFESYLSPLPSLPPNTLPSLPLNSLRLHQLSDLLLDALIIQPVQRDLLLLSVL